MSQIEAQFIEKKHSKDPASDFETLIAQAIDMVQRMTGHTWTDFNLHDPGVTILEQVCYALTDLAYKTDFPIEDLITDVHGFIHRAQHAFFEKGKILTGNAITINDFRKIILDEIEELDNVVLTPITSAHSTDFVKGLYKILIRVNSSAAERFESEPELKEQIKEKVVYQYLEHRNLSEDLIGIDMMEPQKIQLHADIIIKYSIAPEEILVSIYNKLESILNPKINFYSEKELLDNGMKTEEIYCGPLLKNGFIPDSELKPIDDDIDPIELNNAILQVDGVVFVQNIRINNESNAGKPFVLEKNHFPLLDIKTFFRNVHLYTDEYKIHLKENVFLDLINRTAHLRSQKRKTLMSRAGEVTIKMGNYRNPGKYYSLQNNFPINYGIGPEGISSKETDRRKAAALQLKGYLLFFEQIQANYLAQLSNISQLYSTDTGKSNGFSYFYQPLYGVPGIQELLSAYGTDKKEGLVSNWDEFTSHPENSYLKALGAAIETPEVFVKRKNQVFDHLLARFNKKLTGFPALQYYNLYIQGSNEERAAFIVQWKANILDNLVKISQNKIKAFNYFAKHHESSGFEKKAALYLHILHNNRRRLTSVFETGEVVFSSGKSGNIHQNEAYIFRNRGMDVLKYGINIENYKVGTSDNGKGEYIIIYKSPEDEKWSTISQHSTKEAAFEALNKLIVYLRKISVESEGLHVLEHLLLRPDLSQRSFGFRFYACPGDVLFQHSQWMDFEERENTLFRIKEASGAIGASTDKSHLPDGPPVSFQIKATGENSWETVNTEDFNNEARHEVRERLKVITAKLTKHDKDKTCMFPHFELIVRLPDGTIMPEDFYNLRLTIAMPAWPARFQDSEFRAFTENFLCSIAPAHLRLHFKWFSLSRMKKFEDLYFQWLELLKGQASHEEKNRLSANIATWLYEQNVGKQP